jgi:hypothetical protein
MAGLDGVNPELARRFLSMQGAAAAAGFQLGVGSGLRSVQEQEVLRRKNGCPDVYQSPASSCRVPTAIPGRSNHNHGLAIDISGSKAAKAWANANGHLFGLHFPVSGEDWHVEMVGSEGHYTGAQQQGAHGMDVNWLEAPGMTPEEREDQRIGGYFDAMTGAMNDELLAAPQATPELSSPAMTEVGSPDLSAGGGTGTEPAPDIRLETLQQGQPGMTGQPTGGGQWQGGLPPPGFVPPGQGVERWRGIMEAAMRYAGVEPTPALVALGLRRMAQESGGNPTIVNNWDINAKNGDPSIGLMQNIGSAFPERAKELTARGIRDGFANIVASIRYTLGRYGSLERGWGRKGGY